MSLAVVEVTQEVYSICLRHALSTDREEIMGVLLGEVRDDGTVARVWMALPQPRSDRRRDRVETSPEQIAACSAVADHYSHMTGVPTRVVGWYHSHPHITVEPSHVDLHTQALYQMLDGGFVGLIFSCFNADASTHENRVSCTAFQSVAAASVRVASSELAGADSNTRQALQASAVDASRSSTTQWQRKHVDLRVVRAASAMERQVADGGGLQNVLVREETLAYEEALRAHAASGTSGALRLVSNAAAYTQAVCQLIDSQLMPSLEMLHNQVAHSHVQEGQLKAQIAAITHLLDATLSPLLQLSPPPAAVPVPARAPTPLQVPISEEEPSSFGGFQPISPEVAPALVLDLDEDADLDSTPRTDGLMGGAKARAPPPPERSSSQSEGTPTAGPSPLEEEATVGMRPIARAAGAPLSEWTANPVAVAPPTLDSLVRGREPDGGGSSA